MAASSLLLRLLLPLENQVRFLRVQQPIVLGLQQEPEPDVAVVRGTIRQHEHQDDTDVLLVVEVSDSSLRYDRSTKKSLYASAGVPEYWIVNLTDRVLECHRKPNGKSFDMGEANYEENFVLTETQSVSPLCEPTASFLISDMLPLP